MSAPLLQVRGLRTVFHLADGAWAAVDGVDLEVDRGQVLGLVGESGSGKTVTGFSIVGLVDPPGEVIAGEVIFAGEDLRHAPEARLRELRGDRIAMIFQDPMMTLNPVLTIGEQMAEAVLEHGGTDEAAALSLAGEALTRVGIASAGSRLKQYPHEFSGGMRQRVAIATALLNKPDLIIADEPTTALDVTIQGQILFEMQKLARETGAALVWITHDLAVVAELADRIAVMYAGRIVEAGTLAEVLDNPRHPYTRGLLDSVPDVGVRGQRLAQIDGMAPRLDTRPAGCAFAPRCPRASARCREVDPPETAEAGRRYRCHHPLAQGEAR
ncbi:MAG TPA: ABC transporter ATP-binding protein [Usitatibacteraceae bacterium]|nr:ABC transporter ATP-binding protein [Usitatibacteraceae bacterium]